VFDRAAQVFVCALQRPLLHTALANASLHVPWCRPSLGNGAPSGNLVTQLCAVRLQYDSSLQSVSILQP
jgi:hypothetical protein